MNKASINKIQRDKYTAYVGQTYNNVQIWGQYERMIEFLFDEYPKTNKRFDEIAQPFLFTISHAVELALKENIIFFNEYNNSKQLTKFEDFTQLIKSHDLNLLSMELKIVFYRFHKQVRAPEADKAEFNKHFKALEELNKILERNTETYRYSEKINNDGVPVKRSIKKGKLIDFSQIQEIFETVKNLFIGAPNAMGIYTDYIDFKNGNPGYTKGKGKLYFQRLHFSAEFLERVKEHLDEELNKVNENLWISRDDFKSYEIQIWQGDIFVIEV